MDQDLTSAAALLTVILRNPDRRKSFYSLAESEAQELIDLMHQISCLTDLDGKIRSIFIEAMFAICRQYGCYPECLVLHDVAHSGNPVDGGGIFGEIYKGQARGRAIAIKKVIRMRFSTEEDVQNSSKVFTLATYASHISNQDRSLRDKRFCGQDCIIQISCPSMDCIVGSSIPTRSA
jgi:hypothetical protein